jgi:hypothetical protein
MSAATPDSLVCAPPSQAVPIACLALDNCLLAIDYCS